MHRKWMFLLLGLVLVLGASCAPQSNKAEVSNEMVCKNLVLLNQSIDDLQDEQKYSDPQAIQAQMSVVRTNFTNLLASAVNLQTAEKEDFETAVNNLADTASSLPEDITVPEALNELKAPIDAVRQAATNLGTSLQCK